MKINNVSGSTTSNDYKVSETRSQEQVSKLETKKVADHTSESDTKANELNEEMMIKAVDQANKSLKHSDRFIKRDVHEKTKTVMYKLIDSKTEEVIAEFPPKKIQDMVAKMWELAGLFVDEKA